MQQYKPIEFDFTMDIGLIKIVFLPVQTIEPINVALITESTNLANKTQSVMKSFTLCRVLLFPCMYTTVCCKPCT